jgi:myo-inositol catabolism protein IolC
VLDKIFKENGMSVSKEDIAAIVAAKDKIPQQVLVDLQKGMSIEDLAKTHGAELQKIPELQEVLPKLMKAAKEARQAGEALSAMDTDKDGTLTKKEVNACGRKPYNENDQLHQKRSK